MKIKLEIEDKEIIRSNQIGKKYLAKGNLFPADLYYEGIVILEDETGQFIEAAYPLIDFISRIMDALEYLESKEGEARRIEFTEDYPQILISKKEDRLILCVIHELRDLEFMFDDFKEQFKAATLTILAKLMSFDDSKILDTVNLEYFKKLIGMYRQYS